VHHSSEMRTPDGEDPNYNYQRQLAQLKFVDIMPSPDQSLFSSPVNNIPQEWFREVEKLMGDLSLSHNGAANSVTPSDKLFEPTITVFEEDVSSENEGSSQEAAVPKKSKSKLSFLSKLYKDKKRS